MAACGRMGKSKFASSPAVHPGTRNQAPRNRHPRQRETMQWMKEKKKKKKKERKKTNCKYKLYSVTRSHLLRHKNLGMYTQTSCLLSIFLYISPRTVGLHSTTDSEKKNHSLFLFFFFHQIFHQKNFSNISYSSSHRLALFKIK